MERSPKGGTGMRMGSTSSDLCTSCAWESARELQASMAGVYVIGVDVGGTNTDAVVLCGKDVVAAAKRPTEDNKTAGIVNAIRAALDEGLRDGIAREDVLKNVSRVCIGTTHFVNAVVARDRSRLARVAVVRLCGSASRSLGPFCDFPNDLREILCGGVHLVSGGFEYDLKAIEKLNEEELRKVAREISQCDPPVHNVVVCGVFSPHDDPTCNQEQKAAEIIQSECPSITCTLSHKIGLLGLLERENAAILNEALKPLAQQTIRAFRTALDDLGLTCAFYLTQNDGTLISAEEAVQYPVFTFSSGPTNSMRGAAFLSGLCDAIVVDIGGTTTDVGVLKNGFPREASSQRKVGGVRTNFSMPDVLSLELGGGSTCLWNDTTRQHTLGHSVGHRLLSEALCFGGSTCTTTDVAVAAGVAPHSICQVPGALDSLNPTLVYKAMSCIRELIESGIDCVKTEKADVPVVLVGGGSCLLDKSVGLHGAATLIIPEKHWDVANAIGAALGTVGATVDSIESLVLGEGTEGEAKSERVKRARLDILRRARERAISEAVRKGAISSEVYIQSEDLVDVTYVENKLHVRVKAIGPLRDYSSTSDLEMVIPSVEDNPNWPFASADDREKDSAANLPIPHVEDGVWTLGRHDVECVAVGAGLLGCGGGGDPNTGRLLALQQLDSGKSITVVNPLRLKASDVGLLTGVAFMGAPVIVTEKLVAGLETQLALEALQRVVVSGVYTGEGREEGKKGNEKVRINEMDIGGGNKAWIADPHDLRKIDVSNPAEITQSQRITHLLCDEIGGVNSFEPLIVGAERGLPVLDADGMGRAFPELQMYSPFMYGCKPYPSAVADNKGEVITCTYVADSKQLEDFFRNECVRMGMSCAVSTGVLTLREVLDTAILFSVSMAWQLGRAVMRARTTHSNVLQAIASQQSGKILIVGKVTDVVNVTEGGFSRLEAIVEGLDIYKGHRVKVIAKNENYLARYMEKSGAAGTDGITDGAVMATTPDLICMIDSETGYPITTEAVRYGLRVGVLALPANPKLLTPQAMKFVGPAAFGCPKEVQHCPPCSLQEIGKTLLPGSE